MSNQTKRPTPRPTTSGRNSRSRAGKGSRRPSQKRSSSWSWLAFAAPVLVLAIVVAIGTATDEPQHGLLGAEAPGFSLPTTDGTRVALDDVLNGGGQAMLYFSMGVGCDGCFAQIPEIEAELAARGITLVPVMVDPAERVAAEASRFGINDPILIDADRSASEAYGMLGVYGHADRPSHSFALVGADRQVRWVKHYATMFVPAADFFAEVPEA